MTAEITDRGLCLTGPEITSDCCCLILSIDSLKIYDNVKMLLLESSPICSAHLPPRTTVIQPPAWV